MHDVGTVIDPNEYHTNPHSRDTVDEVLARGGLDKMDVTFIERAADRWLVTIFKRNAEGRRFLEDGGVASFVVEVLDA